MRSEVDLNPSLGYSLNMICNPNQNYLRPQPFLEERKAPKRRRLREPMESWGAVPNPGYRSPTYNSWRAMIERCHGKHPERHPSYAGRGISVCPEWRNSFAAFVVDMGPRPEGRTLNRKNNSLGYFKDNCNWATRAEQSLNHSRTRMIEIDGIKKPLKTWADEHGMSQDTIWTRLNAGWPPEKLFISPGTKSYRFR